MSVAKKIKHKFIYFFLGAISFVIGLVLMPFSVNNNGGSLGEHSSTANAEFPDSPDPGPCPTPDPGPTCPDPGPGPSPGS